MRVVMRVRNIVCNITQGLFRMMRGQKRGELDLRFFGFGYSTLGEHAVRHVTQAAMELVAPVAAEGVEAVAPALVRRAEIAK